MIEMNSQVLAAWWGVIADIHDRPLTVDLDRYSKLYVDTLLM